MAVGLVMVLMPLLGWPVSSIAMILAYQVGSLPTRGALASTALGIGAAAIVAWGISDLSIMYIVPHIGRMPQALLYPLLLAGAAGYVMVRFPKLAPIAPITALIPIMSVFGGIKAPNK